MVLGLISSLFSHLVVISSPNRITHIVCYSWSYRSLQSPCRSIPWISGGYYRWEINRGWHAGCKTNPCSSIGLFTAALWEFTNMQGVSLYININDWNIPYLALYMACDSWIPQSFQELNVLNAVKQSISGKLSIFISLLFSFQFSVGWFSSNWVLDQR